jgi:hypothetical protein
MASINEDILRKHFGFNDPNVIRGILSDPGQVARYEREYSGVTGGGGGSTNMQDVYAQQKKDLEAREASQKKEETDFLERFRAAVEGLEPLSAIRQRVIGEIAPGYEDLKETAYQAGQYVSELPTMIRERAEQTGAMTRGQIEQRIGAKVGERLPEVQKLTADLSHIGDLINQAFQLEVGDRENVLIPLQQEAAMISDRLARSVTGYTALVQSQTQLLAQKLANEGALSVQELKNLAEAAKAEMEYFDSEIVIVGGRKKLINKRTGETIMDLGPSGGGGVGGDIGTDIDEWLNKQASGGRPPGASAWISPNQ